MADEATPTGQEPGDGAQAAQNKPATPPTPEPADDFDRDRAMKTITTLRDEVKQLKAAGKEIEGLKQQLKAHEDAKLSETDRLQNRIKELEAAEADYKVKIRNTALKGTVAEMASRMGAVYPSAAIKLIDIEDVEFDKDGDPTNVERLLADAKKNFPLLFRNPSGNADAASGSQTPPAASIDSWIRKQAGIT